MAELKEGVVLRPFGALTELKGTISDDVAKYLIESGKAKETDFIKQQTKNK